MKGWRTLIVNGLVIVGGALVTYLAGPEAQNAMKEFAAEHPTWGPMALAAVNFGLRFITTSAVGKK